MSNWFMPAEWSAHAATWMVWPHNQPLWENAWGVTLAQVRPDMRPFRVEYDPSHPAANAEGYVQRPNVDTLVEAMDMREAQRAYEANLNVIETARSMDSRTLDIIKR